MRIRASKNDFIAKNINTFLKQRRIRGEDEKEGERDGERERREREREGAKGGREANLELKQLISN